MQTNLYTLPEIQELVKDLVDTAEVYSVSAANHIKFMAMINKSLKPFGFYYHSSDNKNWEIREVEL